MTDAMSDYEVVHVSVEVDVEAPPAAVWKALAEDLRCAR